MRLKHIIMIIANITYLDIIIEGKTIYPVCCVEETLL